MKTMTLVCLYTKFNLG